jgi:L-rhamnose mutarotase
MTNVTLVKLRIKPGGKQIWLDWSEELKRRRAEVVATLRSENVASESCFMSEDGEYVFYFMEAEDLEAARRAVAEHPHPIDVEHKEARRSSLEFVAELKCLFHFEQRD